MYDIYSCNKDDSARFILGKRGKRKLIVVGLNPSTANREKSDTTAAKVEKVALNGGFDGFVMTNLYPQRTTDPKGLATLPDTRLFRRNIRHILKIAEAEESPVFWAAWGGDITLRPYLAKSLKALLKETNRMGGTWVNFGHLRKDGHPRHPSRLSYSWQFSKFDVAMYVKEKFATV